MHNPTMIPLPNRKSFAPTLCFGWLLLAVLSPLQAQETDEEARRESTEVEESDEAYRRRMELEDARQRDLGYTLPPETYAQEQEKLDKLPEESRNNIRDQLVDIIVEDGDWEPSDALKDYPYEPTAAAQGNPELKQQEQEAWDEQIEKYHKREAAAFGTYLGPEPGPGNPDGAEGGGPEGEEQDGAAARQQTQQQGQESTAGTYEPYQSNHDRADEEVSTAGVQQSALDFLKGLQTGGQTAPPAGSQTAGKEGAPSGSSAQPDAADSADTLPNSPPAAELSQQSSDLAEQLEQSEQAEPAEDTVEIDLTTPGIIAIDDLDKLEGADASETPEGQQ
jgi:hypothetical protein